MVAPILTKKSKVIQGDIIKSKYHKNTSEINELERDLIPVKILSNNIEKQKVIVFFQMFFSCTEKKPLGNE